MTFFRPPRALALALALAVCGGCAHGRATRPYADWVTVRSDNFIVYTDTSPDTCNEIVDQLEALVAALNKTFFPGTTVRGTEVLLFSTPEAQRAAVARVDTPFVRPDIQPLVLTVRTPERSRNRDVSHYSTLPQQQAATELTARMLSVTMRNAPPWFRVGLQEYVKAVAIADNQARFGHRLPRPTHELGLGRVIPLSKLIAARASEFSGGDWRLSFQASAWAFIHYLLGAEKGTLRPRFDALARALIDADDAGPGASRAAIQQTFPDVDFATLEGKVRDYAVELGQRSYFHAMTVELPPLPHRASAPEPADPLRVQGLLAGLKH